MSLADPAKDVTAERAIKRAHAYSSKSGPQDSKRLKRADVGPASSLESILSSSVQSSQLLQQLVSQQQQAKARDWPEQLLATNDSRTVEQCDPRAALRRGVFEAEAGRQAPAQQQSNSVLMNLLVSGCDVSAGYVCLTKQGPRSSKGIASK